jgi:4-hydroxy-3-polyprenylbenzoate decarboxylase
MPYRTLAEFLDDLGRAGELAAVDAEVDPCLEVAEITRRPARRNGPALLFRNVRGHDIPLLTNLFGTEARILRALGAESIEEATGRIDRALNSGGSEGWLDRLRFGGKGGAAASFAPNRVKSAACQQVVRLGSDINLLELPLVTVAQKTKVPVIQSAVMISAEPETHSQMFLRGDLQIAGRDTAVVQWSDVAEPSRLAQEYRKLGTRMPLAVVIGGSPDVQLAAAAPLPPAVDPLGLAGLLREKPLDAVACRSIDLIVPAESDFLIEGWIDPAEDVSVEEKKASPLAMWSLGRGSHLLHATALTHRANGVFPAVATEPDNNECCIRDRLLARLFLPYVKLRIPELFDLDLPLSGGARHLAILAIEKTYPTQARHVATMAWGVRSFQDARLLIVVDADIDVRDTDQIMTAVVHQVNLTDDLLALDGACDWNGSPGRRLAIDATRACSDGWPVGSRMQDENVEQLVTERWAEYGLGPESEP